MTDSSNLLQSIHTLEECLLTLSDRPPPPPGDELSGNRLRLTFSGVLLVIWQMSSAAALLSELAGTCTAATRVL